MDESTLNWLMLGGGIFLGISEQIPTRGIQNSCITNSAMLSTSFYHMIFETYKFFTYQKSDLGNFAHLLLAFQHLYDFIFAILSLLLDCQIDFEDFFEALFKSNLDRNTCSREEIKESFQQSTITLEIVEGAYYLYYNDGSEVWVPNFESGYYIGESLLAFIFFIRNIFFFV